MKKALIFFVIFFLPFLLVFHGGYGPGRGRPGGPGMGRPGGGRPEYHGHGPGRVGNPIRLNLPPAPVGGWRGNGYFYGGHNYFVWGWAPYAPFYGWSYYYGWHVGLFYYVPEGLRCYSDNPVVPGSWTGNEAYYSSEDAINSALGYCENFPDVINANAQSQCRIRNCVRF